MRDRAYGSPIQPRLQARPRSFKNSFAAVHRGQMTSQVRPELITGRACESGSRGEQCRPSPPPLSLSLCLRRGKGKEIILLSSRRTGGGSRLIRETVLYNLRRRLRLYFGRGVPFAVKLIREGIKTLSRNAREPRGRVPEGTREITFLRIRLSRTTDWFTASSAFPATTERRN